MIDELQKHSPPLPCTDEPPQICQDEDGEELVVIYHDESIFNTNEDQRRTQNQGKWENGVGFHGGPRKVAEAHQ